MQQDPRSALRFIRAAKLAAPIAVLLLLVPDIIVWHFLPTAAALVVQVTIAAVAFAVIVRSISGLQTHVAMDDTWHLKAQTQAARLRWERVIHAGVLTGATGLLLFEVGSIVEQLAAKPLPGPISWSTSIMALGFAITALGVLQYSQLPLGELDEA